MIKDIREINFPDYATLDQATVTINDMGDRSISTQVKIDGSIVPDFSYDWEVEFKGEKYIHPIRKPQGTKDNTSMSAKIDMVFHHWAIYEMKRQYFVEMASTSAGTTIADKYIASLGLNLGNFVTAFNLVLKHYFGNRIVVKLNPEWQYDDEAQFMSISYSYIWDVLQKIHEVYGVRWTLKTNTNGICEILMGYLAEEVSHVFEYGFEGGLLSVQRQVQSTDIRNRLLGRGGEKNLPYRYFKDKDPNSPLFAADPDWIPELSDIAFTELRGKTFRDYVKGWKANRYGGTAMAEPTEAYLAGYNAEKFDPIEYVEDKESIAKYGILVGALENNEDIYPSIQGAPDDVDMIVDAEQVTDDDVDAAVGNDSVTTNLESGYQTYRNAPANSTITIKTRVKQYFSIPAGKAGNLDMSLTATGKYSDFGDYEKTRPVLKADTVKVTIYDKNTNSIITSSAVPVINIPAGDYYYMVSAEVETNYDKESMVTLNIESVHLYTSTPNKSEGWKQTFDIWVRNIWGSSRNAGETDQQYADRVWAPILGDRTGGEARVVFASGWLSFSSDWEFPIVRYAFDDSKSGSEWRLTLAKSEAELEASGKYIPYEGYNASAGDRFFFIGIDMPYQYVLWAEERLDDFKRDSLLKTAEINPTWVVKTDKVRLNEDREGYRLIDSLTAGSQIRLASKQFIFEAYETLYVQSMTYTWGMDTILHPNVEIVVSDKVYAVKNPVAQIQSNIESIQRQVGSLSNIQQIIRQVGDKLYLRKDGVSDVSKSPTRFLGKVTGENFRQGQIGGRDWGFYRDGQGNAILEADKIVARQNIYVNELVVNEATYVGGLQINSAASMNVTAVEDTGDGYVCYFDQKQGSVVNKFMVDDVVLCKQFDAEQVETKFYKSRVIAVNETSITLSKIDVNGTGIPAEGDVLIHYGNYTNKDRQFVIIRDVIGGGYERMLMDLDSVASDGIEYYYAGKAADGKARWFVGNPEQHVKYEDGQLQVKAVLKILPGTTGMDNIEGLPDALSRIDQLQEQVDGVVEAFSFPYTPTPQNYPASEWTTDEKKQAHVGDVFYNIQPYENEDGTVNPDSGKAWRWSQNDAEHSGWHWHPIADSDAVRALQLAQMSVLDADVLFIQTSSQTAKPQLPTVNSAGVITNMNGWSTNAPAWKDGMYIWQSTYTRKGDGSASFSDPTCVSGKDGASVTITSQTVTYQASASGTAVPTGTWSAAIPPVPQGQYLWTRTTVNYSDGKSTTSYSVSRQGANGSSYSNNLMANTGQRFEKTLTANGDHYYVFKDRTVHLENGKTYTISARTNGVFTNIHKTYGQQYVVLWLISDANSPQGILNRIVSTPEMASDGTRGATFKWTAATGEYYLRINFYDIGTWWVEKVKIEEGTVTDTQWSPYPNEMLGVTVASEEIRYAKGNYPSQPADSAFTLTSIGTLTKGQYLWTRTTVNYSDGKQTKSYTVAYIGTDGANGNPGQPGTDGKTTYVHFAYASGITGSLPHPTAVTGFKTTAFAGAKYIGVCTDYNQADPTAHTPYEWSEYKGEDGVGISGIVEQYYLSSSRTALEGGSWSDTRPAWKAGWYYWTRSKTTYTDGTVEYTAGICVTGDAGTSVLAQYSANGSSWHATFQSGDIYMRTSSDNGSTWSPKMPLVGSNYTPNLLANSDFNSKGRWSLHTNVTIDPTHKHEGRNSVKSAQSGLTESGFRGISGYYSEDVKEGDVFTASVWVYAEDLSSIDAGVRLELWGYKDSSRVGTGGNVVITPTKENEWQQFHVSHKMPATSNKAQLYAYVLKNGTAWFASPKLERGNNPSPVWSPAESEMSGTAYTPNLLLNTKKAVIPYSTGNWNYISLKFENQPEFNVGDTFALSVENITVNKGTPDTFTATLYQFDNTYPGGGFDIADRYHMTADNKTASFTVRTKPTKEIKLLLYAGKVGATAGNAVTYENVMLVHGTHTARWSPASSEMVGKDGQWRKFQWAKNTSTATAPTSGWQDTPMTAAAGEYVWIRSGIVVPPATAPSSWDTATRLTGDRGAAGESVYMLDLSNEVSGIACDAAGNVTGSYPTSQASVWKGQSKVTSGITWSIAGKKGIDTANISTSGAVSMSGMTADQATITVQAVVAGVTLQSTISLYKVKPGSSYSENLVVKSDTEIQTSGYLMKRFSVTEDLVLGDLYTMTIWGELASGKVFNVYDNKGIQVVAQPQKKAEGLYTATFTWKRSANATDSSFEIYNFPSNVSGTSTIRRIKLEKGKNTSPVWSPAPDEMVGEPAVVYSILPSVDSVSRKSDGTASVGSITCEKYLTTGNSARVLSTANYLYARQYNENAVGMWALIADNTKTSGTIAVSPALTAVVFELRNSSAASGYTVLDRERVPVLADGADIIKKISDAEYLQQVFPQEENATEISGGVVLTNILGVKNVDTEDVAAFINGGNLGRHNVHGKLLIAGGIPSTEDHPDINLSSRVSYSATRIYEDGTIDTSKLIARDGVQIGNFKITNQNGFSGISGSDNFGLSRYIGSSISFVGTNANRQYSAIIDVSGSLLRENPKVLSLSSFVSEQSLRPAYTNACLSVSARGETAYDGTGGGNFAIECVYGNFAGLRPNTRRIVSSTTLTLLDHTILIDIQRSITITLPTETDDAGKELIEDGQEYILMMSGDKTTGFNHNLKSPKNRINWPETNQLNYGTLSFPAKGLIYLIYCYKRWWGYRISNY